MSRAILALAGLLALIAAACGGGAAEAQAAGSPGAQLFTSQGCSACHGSDGSGGMLGPPLWGKKQLWTRAKLMEYLKNPQAYATKDERLAEQSRTYTLPMPRVDKLTEEDLGRL